MTKEHDYTNRGALFRNKEKRTENSPDYTGDINIDGTTYWLSGWIQEGGKVGNFLSLALGDEKKPQARKSTGNRWGKAQDDGDIPF